MNEPATGSLQVVFIMFIALSVVSLVLSFLKGAFSSDSSEESFNSATVLLFIAGGSGFVGLIALPTERHWYGLFCFSLALISGLFLAIQSLFSKACPINFVVLAVLFMAGIAFGYILV